MPVKFWIFTGHEKENKYLYLFYEKSKKLLSTVTTFMKRFGMLRFIAFLIFRPSLKLAMCHEFSSKRFSFQMYILYDVRTSRNNVTPLPLPYIIVVTSSNILPEYRLYLPHFSHLFIHFYGITIWLLQLLFLYL